MTARRALLGARACWWKATNEAQSVCEPARKRERGREAERESEAMPTYRLPRAAIVSPSVSSRARGAARLLRAGSQQQRTEPTARTQRNATQTQRNTTRAATAPTQRGRRRPPTDERTTDNATCAEFNCRPPVGRPTDRLRTNESNETNEHIRNERNANTRAVRPSVRPHPRKPTNSERDCDAAAAAAVRLAVRGGLRHVPRGPGRHGDHRAVPDARRCRGR